MPIRTEGQGALDKVSAWQATYCSGHVHLRQAPSHFLLKHRKKQANIAEPQALPLIPFSFGATVLILFSL